MSSMIKNEKQFPVQKISWFGIPLEIENKAGSTRSGNKDGHPWSVKMKHHYGRISNTQGLDGDMEDVYLRVAPRLQTVFKISTKDPVSGEFDETKWMLGFHDKGEAEQAFHDHYDRPEFFGYCEEINFNDFKRRALKNKLVEIKSFKQLIKECHTLS